jgi:hypothetical protein
MMVTQHHVMPRVIIKGMACMCCLCPAGIELVLNTLVASVRDGYAA